MAILTKYEPGASPNGWTTGQIPFGADAAGVFLATGALGIDYFLEEVSMGGTKKTLLPLPSQPNRVQVNRIYSENPIYTFDPHFSYREIAAPRVVEVVMEGQTGVSLRVGINEDGALSYNEGYVHLQNFEKFLDKYHHKAASHATPVVYSIQSVQNDLDYVNRPYLVFKGVKENLYGRCVITGFNYSRSTEKNRVGSYTWQLSIKIYDTAEADDPSRFAIMDNLESAKNAVNALTGLSEAVQLGIVAASGQFFGGISDVVGAATGLVNSIANVDDRFYDAYAPFHSLGKQVLGFMSAVGVLFDGDEWAKREDLNRDIVERQYLSPWDRKAAFDDAMSAGDQDSWDPSPDVQTTSTQHALMATQMTLTEVAYQGWLLLGLLGLDDAAGDDQAFTGFLRKQYGFDALATLNQDPNYNPRAYDSGNGAKTIYELRPGESLLTVAHTLLGSPARWSELARLNGAQDAYTKADGTPYQVGDPIYVRMDGIVSGLPLLSEIEDFDALIGTDIEFKNGDLALSALNKDLSFVNGIENLKQAIEFCLKTATGDITYDPRYGLNLAIIGSRLNETVIQLISSRIREALLQDNRIIDVKDLVIEIDPSHSDTLNITLTCVCIGQQDIAVATAIQTA